MADDSVEGVLGLPFREDIIRGVRLFAIVFAALLLCVAAYRMLHSPAAATETAPEAVQPSPEAAPVAEESPEVHPLVVPEPPPVPGEPAKQPVKQRVARSADTVPPAPPAVARTHRTATSPKRTVPPSEPVVLQATQADDSSESNSSTPQQGVGYKSLIEATATRPAVELPDSAPPAAEVSEKPAKGNRLFRAIGKIFHPGGKKETPLALQPKQQ